MPVSTGSLTPRWRVTTTAATATLLLLSTTNAVATAFTVPPASIATARTPTRPTHQHRTTSTSPTTLFGIRCENKYYQLEELEDRDSATTEVYLKPDRTIQFGDTDGPITSSPPLGGWQIEEGTDNFSMWITRKFSSGQEGTDVGVIQFEVTREYKGEMCMVGESVAINGKMTNKDETLGEKEVGFFNMIDGTKERESYSLEGRFKHMVTVDDTKGNKLSDILAQSAAYEQQQEQGQDQQGQDQQPYDVLAPLDPSEVYQTLPPQFRDALANQSFDMLQTALGSLTLEELNYHMGRCIESTLWYEWFSATLALVGEEEAELRQRQFIEAGYWSEEEAGEWYEMRRQQAQDQEQEGGGQFDSAEVLESLPPAMAAAFRNRDLDELNAAIAELSKEEADYHIGRCRDSGLWE